MIEDPNRILLASIKRLLRRGAFPYLRKILHKTHAADLSVVFRSLSVTDQHKLFNMIDSAEKRGVILSEMDADAFQALIENMEIKDIVHIFKHMPTDDVADLVGQMPSDISESILARMKPEGSDEVKDLLRFKDDTAGGIMNPDFIALKENTTARQAVESLQKEHLDVEMPFYLYVVDDEGRLMGVSSLRQLVVVPPDTPLKKLMTTDVFSVRTDMDQEEVAKIVARYDILAVPVVREDNCLVGIVTVDDVIDIFRHEATEDMLKMAGAGEEFVETKSVLKSTRMRLPWLFASCIGGVIAFFIIGYFETSLTKITSLAAFIPVIMGMGGNIGTQSATIVVRGLATNRLHTGDLWKVVAKELSIGMILGMVYGIMIGFVAHLRYNVLALGAVVNLAVLCSMTIAALVGSFIPMILARFNVDPAIATGPFVTTSIDIISVSFYFIIATLFLGV
jgi:magnesium transporter